MSTSHPYHLFHGYGVELEYMLVDKDTLQVKHLADDLLKYELGEIGSDFENGMITWSNELVLHVIELKSTHPESDLEALEKAFTRNISRINTILDEWNAMLMPSAAHPLMDPFKETKLWPHDNNEVYELYNKIFDCSGHGWSNLQSTHLNLPFSGDEEFAKLHAAVRIILPLLPALCASSPILDEKLSGMLDTRLLYYKTNQAKIPSITGSVIPEAVFSYHEYQNKIYSQIEKDIAPYNEENILEPVWVNSRGAIARFDRGSIEIRIMDVQECPAADLSIVNLVVELLKAIVNEKFCNLQDQTKIDTDMLATLFDKVNVSGGQTVIDDTSYLAAFGKTSPITVKDLWKHILTIVPAKTIYDQRWQSIIHTILDKGSLSERIISALHHDHSPDQIKTIYKELSKCLAENRMFVH
jgi:gamma-glutamyl:cysteine ligase YbdK (ATP-grasp superfamily)